ncbi:MAG: DNA-directed RNA polymerase II subunit RPB1 [Piptocephalis tieghemiana]|nr:MAG: DNA-directed RNA polymerase II subunit RPB1 [Piptocephalis tieghemiana]
MSVVRIELPELTDFATQLPVPGGLLDMRMGTVDRQYECQTCGEGMMGCPGHFGHIELSRPVFHVGFILKVKKILECICIHCSKLLVDDSNPKFVAAREIPDANRRFQAVWELCKTKHMCEGDGDAGEEDGKGGSGQPGEEEDDWIRDELGDGDEDDILLGGRTGVNALKLAGAYGKAGKRRRRAHGGCGKKQPLIRKEGLMLFRVEKTLLRDNVTMGDQKYFFPPREVLSILKRISQQDCTSLGLDTDFARPEWLLITCLPVPPPCVRPSIQMDGTSKGEDDLTHKLSDVLKANANVARCEASNSPPSVTYDFERLLQFHVATYMDNEIAGQPQALQKSGRPLKSIRARLKGKEGRLRGNLMGKRVDFSARTVITGDPNLSIDEVGVPISVAKNLTFPELVTSYNIERLMHLVRNGPTVHPGAKFVFTDAGDRIDLRFKTIGEEVPLQLGWKVERHLVDGDLVVFNRQPSLHKMSMMGHRVRVMPYSTFRLNLSVTSPYNADFDGDEMNLHVPQSYESKAEIRELCMVPKNIVSPQKNAPVMGIVQDTLCGVNLFTRRDTFLDRGQVMNLLMWLPRWDGHIPMPAICYPKPLWTGKQLISLIIPKGTTLVTFHSTHPDGEGGGPNAHGFNVEAEASPGDTRVRFMDGELVCGIVCKRTVGTSQGGLIHVICNEHGPDRAADFLNGTQCLVNTWLLHHGFSIGIGDTIADARTMENINATILTAKSTVTEIIMQAQQNRLERKTGMTLRESFENDVNSQLNRAREEAGKCAQAGLRPWNNAKQMVIAGSKGSNINICQMTACVGQQNVEGKRIPYGFRQRSLPHFHKDDYSPESRGFVENSYLRGLTPTEFFFHAMGGREGLIDTAVKTAETGYIQRRLVKALEDLMVQYDGTVRNALGHVVQFCYGEDGMDAVALERQKLEGMRLSDADFEQRFRLDLHDRAYATGDKWPNAGAGGAAGGSGASEGGSLHLRQAVAELKSQGPDRLESTQAILEREWKRLKEDRELLRTFIFPSGDNSWPLPVNVRRLIWNAQDIFHLDKLSSGKDKALPSIGGSLAMTTTSGKGSGSLSATGSGFIHPAPIVEAVERLVERLAVVRGDDPLSKEAQRNATLLFQIHLRSTFSVRRVLEEYRLSAPAFEWIMEEIESRFATSLVSPGEMVGTLAAQSIGEPATQMTLNTFHFAGVSSKNVTLGVPRLKEVINVATNIKTPSLTVYLDEEYGKNIDRAQEVQARVQHADLAALTLSSEIIYDPDLGRTVVAEDAEDVETWYELEAEAPDTVVHRLSPWVLRLRLDPKALQASLVDLDWVKEKMRASFRDDMYIMTSQADDHDRAIVRCRIIYEEGKTVFDHDEPEDVFLRRLESDMLHNISITGIPGINRVYMVVKQRTMVSPSGEFDRHPEWVLDTEGCALADVMSVEGVDFTRAYSNSIIEIMDVLGIEAARKALLLEMRMVIEFDGSYVNHRHLALLCDAMTARGKLMPITRHGINRTETGALARSSFEETVEILMEAASSAETDACRGVTENIILGQLAPLGTGSFDLILDEEKLRQYAPDIPMGGMLGMGMGGGLGAGGMTPYGGMSPGAAGMGGPATPYHMTPYATPGGGMSSPGGSGTPGGRLNDFNWAFSPAASVHGGAGTPGGFGAGGAGGMTPISMASGSGRYGASASPGYSPTGALGGGDQGSSGKAKPKGDQ